MRAKAVLSIAGLAVATAITPPALAATVAEATTALNIRSGPGPEYAVVGVIEENDEAVIQGCIENSLWCQVTHGGKSGWAYSRYLTANASGRAIVIAEDRVAAGVPVVTYAGPAATVGSAPVQVTGALVDTTTAAAPVAISPPSQVTTYVTANPVQPTYLSGEVVVGAGLPAEVVLQPVPQYQYQYAYVNSVPVLVEPASRRIVYVYR